MLGLYLDGSATCRVWLDKGSLDISDRYCVTCSNGVFGLQFFSAMCGLRSKKLLENLEQGWSLVELVRCWFWFPFKNTWTVPVKSSSCKWVGRLSSVGISSG